MLALAKGSRGLSLSAWVYCARVMLFSTGTNDNICANLPCAMLRGIVRNPVHRMRTTCMSIFARFCACTLSIDLVEVSQVEVCVEEGRVQRQGLRARQRLGHASTAPTPRTGPNTTFEKSPFAVSQSPVSLGHQTWPQTLKDSWQRPSTLAKCMHRYTQARLPHAMAYAGAQSIACGHTHTHTHTRRHFLTEVRHCMHRYTPKHPPP